MAIAVSTHEQVGIAQPRQHLHGLLFRQNPFGPHAPLLPNLHARHRVAPSLGPVAPFLGLGVDAGHDAAQVVHHVPGFAGLEQPLLDLIGLDLAQTPVAPLRDDALFEVDHVLQSRVGFASRNRPATSASTCAALYFSTILLKRAKPSATFS